MLVSSTSDGVVATSPKAVNGIVVDGSSGTALVSMATFSIHRSIMVFI